MDCFDGGKISRTLVGVAIRLFKMVLLCFVAVPALATDDIVVHRDIMIPMRDGVLLATDVYRPAVNGVEVAEPRPVLLTRLPYNKDRESTVATDT